ncbi:hypothetical protein [Terriglobus albidus]|uniref:hypothetical protein n=1 Tax=Terriglobus albidus TaxID=1592106 RepID=UPI0021E06C27|nr:hypothetical protein [Terriglobus albidus]
MKSKIAVISLLSGSLRSPNTDHHMGAGRVAWEVDMGAQVRQMWVIGVPQGKWEQHPSAKVLLSC